MNRKIKYSLFAGFPTLVYFIYKNFPKLDILTGFAAKTVCSCTFLAHRDQISVEAGENDFFPVKYAQNKIDLKEKSVSTSILGLKTRKAVYQEGLGCVLLPENAENFPLDLSKPLRDKNKAKNAIFGFPGFKDNNIALQNAFDAEGAEVKKTRAVLVLYKSQIIAEKYASGFSTETKFLGWSMTKSIVNAVLGVLEKQGRISLSQTHLFQEWEKDERSKISLKNLLQMNSGLEWSEDYTSVSDVNKMLFLENEMAQVQLHKSLKSEPGTTWNYSSGTTNLLSKFIRNQFKTHQEYLDFWYSGLIDKIGMNSMTLETDAAGSFVGSSYGFATARDWAKFGLLFLNKGNWDGEQILNDSWVDFTVQPANGSKGEYAAHFWLNAGGKYQSVPRDMFACCGFQGQYIFIIPSKKLVVVRFGLSEHPVFDVNEFLKEILESF